MTMDRICVSGILTLLLPVIAIRAQDSPSISFESIVASGVPCSTDEDCDTGNQCMFGDCIGNECAYGYVDPCCSNSGVCYDGDPCTLDWSCNGAGVCDYPPLPNGSFCNAHRCMLSGSCQNGSCVGPWRECPFGSACQVNGSSVCLILPYEEGTLHLTDLLGAYEPNRSRTIELHWGHDWYHLNRLAFRFSGTCAVGVGQCPGTQTPGVAGAYTLALPPVILAPPGNYSLCQTAPGEQVPMDKNIFYDVSRRGSLLDGPTLTFNYRMRTDCDLQSPPVLVIDEFTVEYAGRRMFDANGDALVDLLDHETFATCLIDNDGETPPECAYFDRDRNDRVDLLDTATFQNSFLRD